MPALTKYEVLEELGHGGMATVYRAHDKRLARDVAVKVLHPHLRDSREIAHRFAAEAKAVAKLRHPNIVEVFDVSSDEDDEQFLVVELVRGRTLRQLLQSIGALPPEIAVAIAIELLSALVHAHASGVVHRDVKPENVLVEHRPSSGGGAAGGLGSEEVGATGAPAGRRSDGERGDRVAVKLTDFGIAKLLDAQGVTSTGQVLGSPAHMAPEQIEGGEVDGRADVFGMGVLLYECLVGHLPFEGNNPAQVLRRVLDGVYPPAEREVPSVGKTWSVLVDRALARHAEDRFESAQAMRDALSAELERIGFVSGRSVLEAYLDDPEGWSEAHTQRMIARLCELGGEARKRGNAVAAAADYNRALAYAPTDPSLLRVVASMHRAEARMRLVKRIAPLVIGGLALGCSAYVIARAVKERAGDAHENAAREAVVPGATARQTATGAPGGPPASPTASAVPPEQPTSPTSASRAKVAASVVNGASVTVPTLGRRPLRLVSGTLHPRFGVHMSVDGAPSGSPEGRFSVTLDDKPHVLTFTCKDPKGAELCVSRNVNVAAGDRDETIDVALQVLPARVVVLGPAGASYGIEEMPGVTLAAGLPADVPMSSGSRDVTLYDRGDPARRRSVKLLAGKQQTISLDASTAGGTGAAAERP